MENKILNRKVTESMGSHTASQAGRGGQGLAARHCGAASAALLMPTHLSAM